MTQSDPADDPALRRLVDDLRGGAGARLKSVVLYGSAARGDFQTGVSDLNVIVVLDDVGAAALEAVGPALRRFRRKGQPLPRLFTPALIRDSLDTFPAEFLDIKDGHRVLHGDDPFAGLAIRTDHLRLQCERELKERLIALREGYVEAFARPRALRALLVASYGPFAAILRGALRVLGAPVPVAADDVVAEICRRAGLDTAPFQEVAALHRGGKERRDLKSTFSDYHDQLTRAAHVLDGSRDSQGGAR